MKDGFFARLVHSGREPRSAGPGMGPLCYLTDYGRFENWTKGQALTILVIFHELGIDFVRMHAGGGIRLRWPHIQCLSNA